MRFGLYFELQCPPGKDHAQVYREAMQQVEAGDALGFDVVSMVEHHCKEQFSISANPLAFFAAMAQRTKRIRFRTALHTLALHHPLHLAGQIAAADILTGGRLECGLGRGHPWNFISAGVPMEESRDRFEEGLKVLEMAWNEPAVNFEGRYHSYANQVVVPKPLQKPHPKFYMKVGDPRIAQRGWGVLVPPVYPHAEVAERLATYDRDCRTHGHTPDIVYLRAVYMDEDPAQARREAGEALRNFLAFNASPVATLPGKEDLEKKGYGFYATGALENLARLSLDEIIDREIAFVGTPEQVTRQIAGIKAIPGIGELCVIANFGGIEHWKTMKTMQLLAEKVMPVFR